MLSSQRYQECSQGGLTLLELLVALAIGAILLTLALPSMQSVLGDSEMSATSNELVFSLQTARSEAIKRAMPVALCPSASPLAEEPSCGGSLSDGWIVFADANGNGTRETTDEIVLQMGARSPVFEITAATVFTDRVNFGIAGNSVNTAGVPLSGDITLNYKSGTEVRVITVSAGGRIATVDGSVD